MTQHTLSVSGTGMTIDNTSVKNIDEFMNSKDTSRYVLYSNISEQGAFLVLYNIVFCGFLFEASLQYKEKNIDNIRLTSTYNEYIRDVPQDRYFNSFAAFEYTLPKVLEALKAAYGNPSTEVKNSGDIYAYTFRTGKSNIKVEFGRDHNEIIIIVFPDGSSYDKKPIAAIS